MFHAGSRWWQRELVGLTQTRGRLGANTAAARDSVLVRACVGAVGRLLDSRHALRLLTGPDDCQVKRSAFGHEQ